MLSIPEVNGNVSESSLEDGLRRPWWTWNPECNLVDTGQEEGKDQT